MLCAGLPLPLMCDCGHGMLEVSRRCLHVVQQTVCTTEHAANASACTGTCSPAVDTWDLLRTEALQRPYLLLPAVDDKYVQGEPVPGVEDVGFTDVEAQVPLQATCLVRATGCQPYT